MVQTSDFHGFPQETTNDNSTQAFPKGTQSVPSPFLTLVSGQQPTHQHQLTSKISKSIQILRISPTKLEIFHIPKWGPSSNAGNSLGELFPYNPPSRLQIRGRCFYRGPTTSDKEFQTPGSAKIPYSMPKGI